VSFTGPWVRIPPSPLPGLTSGQTAGPVGTTNRHSNHGAVPSVPPPPADPDGALDWVDRHLTGLWSGPLRASPRFRGGATAAARALAAFDVTGYASRRNEVAPAPRRGASALSPYIRHGLLTLPEVWDAVEGGPARDVRRFRDELTWQEYARHLYARLGPATARPLRAAPAVTPGSDPWDRRMACVEEARRELETDGWMVNQARMWLASQWTVRHGRAWQEGENRFFVHLLDGSRAANRLGWQWSVGTATGRVYGFSRRQVERRAPGTCGRCTLRADCPIEDWPDDPPLRAIDEDPRLRADPDPEATAGPRHPWRAPGRGEPEAVWLTAESLGDGDPALATHPGLPAAFVFDAPLLARLGLSAKRLVFLAESLGDLAARREVEVFVGDPVGELAGRRLAATFTPVPGWRRRARRLAPVAVHPWPWLRRPGSGSVRSYSAWR
jgi:deoxyribodipyrimidine photo-lyase